MTHTSASHRRMDRGFARALACDGGEPADPSDQPEQLYRWHWRKRLPERHGQLFRVLARGKLNSCLIEFLNDGTRYVTSRNALRRA